MSVVTARAVARPMLSRFHGPEAAPTPAAASSPYRKCSSPSALTNSCADVNRSAGTFSSALRMAASTLAGTELRCFVADARFTRDDLAEDHLRGATSVRRLSDQHFVEDTPQGIDVGRCADAQIARGLLRAHVMRRAYTQASLRQPTSARDSNRQSNPEVRDDRLAVLQQDVGGLDVSVDDSLDDGRSRAPQRRLWRC